MVYWKSGTKPKWWRKLVLFVAKLFNKTKFQYHKTFVSCSSPYLKAKFYIYILPFAFVIHHLTLSLSPLLCLSRLRLQNHSLYMFMSGSRSREPMTPWRQRGVRAATSASLIDACRGHAVVTDSSHLSDKLVKNAAASVKEVPMEACISAEFLYTLKDYSVLFN